MRFAFLAAALATLPLTDGTATVTVSDAPALSFEDGAAYVMALDGFGVIALATAPLEGGTWAVPDDAPFVYVEARVYGGVAEGSVPLGSGASVTVQRWEAGGGADDGAPVYLDPEGTLTLASVTDSLVTGTIEASMTRLDLGTGDESAATLRATFEAVPGQIPPP